MRCAECKHSSVEYNKRLSCSNEHFKQGYFYSANDIIDGEVWVEDDEGWAFYVTPSFGCVHFEERTANINEGVALQPATEQIVGAEPPQIKPDCGNCLLCHECTYYGFPSGSCGYVDRA